MNLTVFSFFLGGQTCCEHAAATGPAGEGGPAHLQGQQEKGIVVFRGAYCMSNTSWPNFNIYFWYKMGQDFLDIR